MRVDQTRKVRMGMVGGGQGAFIGEVHRLAAALDGKIGLVCAAFSRDYKNTKLTGAELGIAQNRLYASYEDMMVKEAALPESERMDFVSIVTPNHMHYPVAVAALESGFAVLSDKPATATLDQAQKLAATVERTGGLFGLTHTYLGYPMVWQAKEMVARGDLGAIRKIYVEYPQGWLSQNEENGDNKQAAWRTDPAKSGISGCMGDIGTHAHNLAEFVSGQNVSELCADLNTFVEGRRLDDDGAALLRFDGGASGVLMASQVCVGEENSLKIRIYGEKGGLEWHQMEPNTLIAKWHGQPAQIFRAGSDHSYLCHEASRRCRTPSGHPEGYLEAFANLYKDFASAILAGVAGEAPGVPGIGAGIRGMAFIDAIVKSSNNNSVWTKIEGTIK